MDPQEANYVQLVSTYIHLNPVRLGLVPRGRNKLRQFKWSSYPLYLARRCPEWLSRAEVLGSLGLDEQKRRGYEAYMEGRVLEWTNPKRREDLEEQWKVLRWGWYLGGQSFLERLEGGWTRLWPANAGNHTAAGRVTLMMNGRRSAC